MDSQTVSFKSAHGQYRCAMDDGRALQVPHKQHQEAWRVMTTATGKKELLSIHGKYLCAMDNGIVVQVPHHEACEKWELLTNGDGSVSFLSAHGTYLCAMENGSLAQVAHNSSWEKWSMESCSDCLGAYKFVRQHDQWACAIVFNIIIHRLVGVVDDKQCLCRPGIRKDPCMHVEMTYLTAMQWQYKYMYQHSRAWGTLANMVNWEEQRTLTHKTTFCLIHTPRISTHTSDAQ